MSEQTTKKYLYLPMEIVVREHDGKATMAYRAAQAGWTVVMGPKLVLYDIQDQLPEGVFIVKSITPNEIHQLKQIKQAGHKICSLDEEGVVTFRKFLRKGLRFSDETVSEVDKIFFWGKAQFDVFNEEFPDQTQKSFITGSPRLEFWRNYADKVYKDQASDLREKYGSYVMLPSSFGIANNALQGQGVIQSQMQTRGLNDDVNDFLHGQMEQNTIVFKEYLEFLPELVKEFPDTNFIIRPHPSESHETWEQMSKDHDNIHFCYEGSVTPWILGSSVMLHFKSTTSIEAHMMGVPVITYMPPLPEYMLKYHLEVPMSISNIAHSRQEFISTLSNLLGANKDKRPGELTGTLAEWADYDPKQSAAEKIVELITDISPSANREFKTPEPVSKVKLRSQLKSFLKIIDQVPLIHKHLPNKVKNRLTVLAYGTRKYLGLDIENTRRVIDTIQQQSNDQPLNVSNLTEDLFVIKKQA